MNILFMALKFCMNLYPHPSEFLTRRMNILRMSPFSIVSCLFMYFITLACPLKEYYMEYLGDSVG